MSVQELMFCYVIKPPSSSSVDLFSPTCIDKFSVMVGYFSYLLVTCARDLAVAMFVCEQNNSKSYGWIFSARCNIYISGLCYDVSVRLSVRLSVTEVHWRIIANLGFKFRSKFTAHCGRSPQCVRMHCDSCCVMICPCNSTR